tara:strand:+ start:464 stop:739 length:276 start_codon:yes stop_codon:yes gene_type:complete
MGNGKKRTAKTIKTGGIKKSPLIKSMKPLAPMAAEVMEEFMHEPSMTYDAIPFKNKAIDRISYGSRLASYGSRLAKMQSSLPTPERRSFKP